jgi:hypothetical protein
MGTNYIMAAASLVLLAVALVQSHRVSWKHDKCGMVGVWALGASSMYMLFSLTYGITVDKGSAAMVVAFCIWLTCRLLNKRKYPNGPLSFSYMTTRFGAHHGNSEHDQHRQD